MTYSGQSPILDQGQATAAQIDTWFATNGHCPPGLGMAIISACSTEHVNSDLVAAQCAHESAYWTSAIAKDKNNPAGIGAENDDPYGKAITFASAALGIQAQVYHLLTYCKGEGYWGLSDPRYAAVKAAGWLGVAKVLSDLDGKWAYPGVGYGAQIAARANALVATIGETMPGDDTRFTWTPDAGEFGYPTGAHGRGGWSPELLILHITMGTDSLAWLQAANGSSAHYLTDQAGKPRAQLVAEADAAWTAGNRGYNQRGINVEVEMLAVTDWTDAIMRETARTIAPIMARNSIPAVYLGRGDSGPGKRGMLGHRDVPDGQGGWGGSGHHDDPGAAFDWATFTGYVAAELAGGQQPAPGADPQTGKYIASEFQGFYDQHGGIDIFGRPESGAFIEDTRLTQYFERSVMQRFPENAGTPYEVQLRLLGTEELVRRYPNGAPA